MSMSLSERKKIVDGLLDISQLPDCQESQNVAIWALKACLERLKSAEAPAASTNRYMAYLPCLTELFMCIQRKDFIRACNLVDEFVCLYWEEENTYGIVSVLENL